MKKLKNKHRKIVKRFMKTHTKEDERTSCHRQLFFAGIGYDELLSVFKKLSTEIGENKWYRGFC